MKSFRMKSKNLTERLLLFNSVLNNLVETQPVAKSIINVPSTENRRLMKTLGIKTQSYQKRSKDLIENSIIPTKDLLNLMKNSQGQMRDLQKQE